MAFLYFSSKVRLSVLQCVRLHLPPPVSKSFLPKDGFFSNNKIPHITLGINKNNGGRARMSNDLTNWEKIRRPLLLTGKVTEIKSF